MIDENILSSNIADVTLKNVALEEWRKKYVPIRAFCLLISILGIIGNGMLIYLLSCRIKKTRFTVYILNITSADLLLIFNYFVDNVIFFISTRYFVLIQFLQYITYLFGNDASMYFLSVICVERYLMVFFPAWYQFHRPKQFTVFTCVILWALSLVMMLWEYFSCHPKYYLTRYFKCDIIISIHTAINFLIFISVMFFSTLALLIRIQRPSQRNLPTRLDISIVAAVVRLFIFWIPIRIIDLLRLWIFHKYFPDHFTVMLILESIYSSVCPYIYLFVGWWKSQKVQRFIHVFIERALTDREENTSMTTQEDQEQA